MKILKKLESSDGSIKYLFELADKNTIETLYMHDHSFKLTYNSTVCVSSQVGCNIGCIFCATGSQGFVRNLSAHEIEEQVKTCNDYCKSSGIIPIDAVVFAGMGEPLLNYENVKNAIQNINKNLSINNFEIATVGIVPQIYKLIDDFKNEKINIRLNLSLHATTDELRRRLIPLTGEYNIEVVLKSGIDYAETFNRKTRIRYMLFKGLNDTANDIERLVRLLKNKPVKLVISHYNENNIPGLIAPEKSDVVNFYNNLKDILDCSIFHTFGSDINGGCGQLKYNANTNISEQGTLM